MIRKRRRFHRAPSSFKTDWGQVENLSCGLTNQNLTFYLEMVDAASSGSKRRRIVRLVINPQVWGCINLKTELLSPALLSVLNMFHISNDWCLIFKTKMCKKPTNIDLQQLFLASQRYTLANQVPLRRRPLAVTHFMLSETFTYFTSALRSHFVSPLDKGFWRVNEWKWKCWQLDGNGFGSDVAVTLTLLCPSCLT